MSARLELRYVSLRYGRSAEPALRDLSLSVEPGELVALRYLGHGDEQDLPLLGKPS